MRHPLAVRIGAAIWVALPLYVIVEIVVASKVTVGYSFLTHTISDLAATSCIYISYWHGPVAVCSPWHPLMNVALALCGMGLAVGGWLISSALVHSVWRTAARVCLAGAGLSAVATSLAPIDQDINLHSAAAAPFFILGPVAVFTLGMALRPVGGPIRPVGTAGVVVGGLCALAAAWTMLWVALALNWAIPERLALWPLMAWAAVAGWVILLTHRREASPAPTGQGESSPKHTAGPAPGERSQVRGQGRRLGVSANR